jgi:hypothetical protein
MTTGRINQISVCPVADVCKRRLHRTDRETTNCADRIPSIAQLLTWSDELFLLAADSVWRARISNQLLTTKPSAIQRVRVIIENNVEFCLSTSSFFQSKRTTIFDAATRSEILRILQENRSLTGQTTHSPLRLRAFTQAGTNCWYNA